MVAYLRLLLNKHDELSLKRIINVPNRKIGPKTIGDLQQWTTEKGVTLYQAIQQVEQHPTLGKAAKNALAEFGRLMADLTIAIEKRGCLKRLKRFAKKAVNALK